MKKIFFHGFLGNREQFSAWFDQNSFFFPIDEFIDQDIQHMYTQAIQFLENDKAILIGYSFGARIAMQIFSMDPSRFDKLILLGGHAGLKHSRHQEERKLIEEQFISKIETLDKESFQLFWNNLELFNSDKPILIENYNPKHLVKYFKNWGLSGQPYLLETLKAHKDKVFWFFGEKDVKYCDYAKAELKDFKVEFIADQGHRVYQSLLTHEKVRKLL